MWPQVTSIYKIRRIVMLNKDRMPVHVAIIMDGNGRWAKKEVFRDLQDIMQG